eukprot:m.150058 g.150058  ORF g.150058 m.150058 type:complete len:298 (-) comp13277_c0_seq5:2228-3121(-)
MDVNKLSASLQHLESSGIVLSTERKVALKASLVLLRSAEKLSSVRYWGRIKGVAADYHIAQGSNNNGYYFKTFYSVDCIRWAQLPEMHQVIINSCKRIKGRFTGNPSHEFTVSEPGLSSEEERPSLPEEVEAIRHEETVGDGSTVVTTTISEEKRLAASVAMIDEETRIVPRGAFRMDDSENIVPCESFNGLSSHDAGKIASYCHFRAPVTLLQLSDMERAKLDKGLDFLDPLSDDIPKSCWSIQYQNGGESVVLRSQLWIGAVFVHVPNATLFTQCYVGNGQRNNDLIFELPVAAD